MVLNLDSVQQNLIKDSFNRPSQDSDPRLQFTQDPFFGPREVIDPERWLTLDKLLFPKADFGIQGLMNLDYTLSAGKRRVDLSNLND